MFEKKEFELYLDCQHVRTMLINFKMLNNMVKSSKLSSYMIHATLSH